MLRLPSIEKLPVRCMGLIAGAVATTASALPGNIESIAGTPSSVERAQEEKKFASRRVRLDFSAWRRASEDVSSDASIPLVLPLPEGGETTFTLLDSGVLPPELAKRFPDIRSMKGSDAYGRQIRLDMSTKGVRAIVFDSAGTWRVQPAIVSGTNAALFMDYVSIRERSTGVSPAAADGRDIPSRSMASGHAAREYRLAVATTSAFTRHHGGTVADGLAAVAEITNRVNTVFERDLDLHLTLAKDNDKIIFVDPASDPYMPAPGVDPFDYARSQNVRVTNEMIGAANYDVGHLFVLEEDGVGIDAVCRDEGKADAVSGVLPATGDGAGPSERLIEVVLHELGHQFGADHTFNGCARSGEPIGFEPGSGSTLMSYAGGCFQDGKYPEVDAAHNLQGSRDAYFHAKTMEQVRAFVNGPARVCGVRHDSTGQPPIIARVRDKVSHVIPARTPFVLEGFATSPRHGAQLTYAWEQIDPGSEQAEGEYLSDKGAGTIFRSYPPAVSGVREFPRLAVVLGEEPIGKEEVYPATTRELDFRLTVRDNLTVRPSTSFVDRKVRVVDTGQAFAITYPTAGTTWKGAGKRLVTWNVGGTAKPPIACSSVRIDLSTDGGHSYLPRPLSAATPNAGRALVSLPALARDLTEARLRVSCNDHVFFAVSPGNFTVRR